MRTSNELVAALGSIKLETEQGIINILTKNGVLMTSVSTDKETYAISVVKTKSGRDSLIIDDGMDVLNIYKSDVTEGLKILQALEERYQ